MHPVLWTWGEWSVPAYGVGLALALVVAWSIVSALGRRDRLPRWVLATTFAFSAGSGILVARMAWVLQHPDAYVDAVSLLSLRAGELAPFAGIVVGLLVSAMHLAARKVPPTVAWDVAAPAFAAAAVVERVGALLAGTGAGRDAPELTFAIRFPAGSPVFDQHRETLGGLLPAGATASLPVHPTQVYGMLLAAIGLWLCLRIRARRRFSGQVLLAFGMYVVATRAFVEEWFRADAAQAVFGPLSGAQVAAAVLIVALATVYRARHMRAAGRNDGLRLWEGGRWSPQATSATTTPAPTPTSSQGSARAGKGSPKKKRKGRKKR
jgi:phosphatidylglycerol:prolipoprotein diacylglycerol transferase